MPLLQELESEEGAAQYSLTGSKQQTDDQRVLRATNDGNMIY